VTLPKHLRPRWRYVAVALSGPEDLDGEGVERATRRSARTLLGDPGAADARLDLIECTRVEAAEPWRAVFRVRRGEVEAARAALACVDAVDGDPVGVRVVGVSGTLRACRRRYLDDHGDGESATDGDQ